MFTCESKFASSLAIRPFSSIFLLRKTIAAPIAAIVAPMAAKSGFAAINDLTASAAVLKPFATPLRTLVDFLPVLERLSTESATPLTVFVIVEFVSEAV